MGMVAICSWLLLLAVVHSATPEQSCYADDPNPYLNFGFKTDPRVLPGQPVTSIETGECRPLRLWMVTRPGVSWPGQSMMDKIENLRGLRENIVSNHAQGLGQLCAADLTNLKRSHFPPDLEIAGTLDDQGERDMQELGRTVRSQLPSLLTKPYSHDDYEFRYLKHSNIEQSVAFFTKGLFGDDFNADELPKPLEEDLVLDLPQNCEAWRTTVINDCAADRGKLDRSKPMSKLIRDVSSRLGFKNQLDIGQVVLMYEGCALEKATQPSELAAWCAVFSSAELKLLEYREDLFMYRAAGPGDKTLLINRLSCPLVKDMMHAFKSLDKNESSPQATFHFTDEKSLLILLNGLDLVENTLGGVDNMDLRTYRTSGIAPFAANLMAILYSCNGHKSEDLKVGFYLNGRPRGEPLVSWAKLRRELSSYYEDSLECKLEPAEYCRVNKFSLMQILIGNGAIFTFFGTLLALTPVL